MDRPRYDLRILLRPRGIFRPLVDRLKLAKLQSERAQVSKDSEAERKRLLASGVSEEEASRLAIQYHKGDFRVTHTNIVVFLSDRLIEKAKRLQVPVPQDEKYWTQLKSTLPISTCPRKGKPNCVENQGGEEGSQRRD